MKINLGHQSSISRMRGTLYQASQVLSVLSREQNLGLRPGLSLGSAGRPLMRGSSLVESHGDFVGGRRRNSMGDKKGVSLQPLEESRKRRKQPEKSGRDKKEGKKKGITGGEGGIEHETREHGNATRKIMANIQTPQHKLCIELGRLTSHGSHQFGALPLWSWRRQALCGGGVPSGQ